VRHDPFWGRVIELLKAAKLSRKQFAVSLQIPPRTFEGWIYSNRIPDAIIAHKMAVLLGVSADYLSGGNDSNFPAKRFKELAARSSAARIESLAHQIRNETRLLYRQKRRKRHLSTF
jgi:transcriptional regulator with XRE-family HTH domain